MLLCHCLSQNIVVNYPDHPNFQPSVLDIAVSKHCNLSKPLSVSSLSSDHSPVVFTLFRFRSPSDFRKYACWPATLPIHIISPDLHQSSLQRPHQTLAYDPSARCFTSIPRRTVQCHHLTLSPILARLKKPKKLSDSAVEDPGSAVSSPSPNSVPGWLNYEIPNGSPFWAHNTPKQNYFRRSPGTLLHPHDLFRPYSTTVCTSTIQLIKPNS